MNKIGLCLLAGMLTVSARADEGMWTFDNPPLKILKEKYNFTPDAAWLEKLRLASVRFMDGGSGSFVSARGLVLTNHHVAVGQLQKMSSAEHDYVAAGFYAKTPEEEIKCPDLELNILEQMENVTDKVLAVAKGLKGEAAVKARDAEKARLEKEFQEKYGGVGEVVSLYQGGEYWLYGYRKITDVRLVFAPERQAAFYGGDWDNFTYPRHDLDFAIFRAYDQGKPLESRNFLRFNTRGANAGDLVFISGHPGRTSRLYTSAQLAFEREVSYPFLLEFFESNLQAMRKYSERGPEHSRRALVRIFGFENAKKAYLGMLQGLEDPVFIKRQQESEAAFRKLVDSRPEWKKEFASAWQEIADTLKQHRERLKRVSLESLRGAGLADRAVTMVILVGELEKPDADRLEGYHDSDLERLKFQLFSPAPIYPDFEVVNLETVLRFSLKHLPADSVWRRILEDLGDPKDAAEKLCSSTRLVDPKVRRELVDGGRAAVEKSDDPLMVLARKLAPLVVENTRWLKKNVESVTVPASERIGKARFAVYGKDAYPDATFTLRLGFGAVRGYPMNGTLAPERTTLYGLYDRALGFSERGDWKLPERFWQRKHRLDLSTPVNFVCDGDIIGGNSGSPVVDREGRAVGLVFDGNIESLPGRYFFDDTSNRTVSVHAAYIIEALRKLYDAEDLADEIEMP